jgi:hypothetical protein
MNCPERHSRRRWADLVRVGSSYYSGCRCSPGTPLPRRPRTPRSRRRAAHAVFRRGRALWRRPSSCSSRPPAPWRGSGQRRRGVNRPPSLPPQRSCVWRSTWVAAASSSWAAGWTKCASGGPTTPVRPLARRVANARERRSANHFDLRQSPDRLLLRRLSRNRLGQRPRRRSRPARKHPARFVSRIGAARHHRGQHLCRFVLRIRPAGDDEDGRRRRRRRLFGRSARAAQRHGRRHGDGSVGTLPRRCGDEQWEGEHPGSDPADDAAWSIQALSNTGNVTVVGIP